MKIAGINPQMALAAMSALAGVLSIVAPSAACCPGDQVWVISTRHIDEVPCHQLPEQVCVRRFEGGCWRRSTLAEFVAYHDPNAVTLFYIHGNRYSWEAALDRGWQVYRRLRQGGGHVPLRYVIWSWPSDRMPGPLNDVRAKAERTDLEGLYLGTVLSRLPPDARISLTGFSFGTRIISGALHLLGGGALEGRVLPPEFLMPRLPVRAALMAPAFQNTWLLPGAFHARALTQVERMLVLYNPRDPVLRRYRLLAPGANAQALGYTGLEGLERLGPLAYRVIQIDVSDEVGLTHDQDRYLYSSYFRRVREYLLWRTWR
ncbi:MAG: hypothetical protein KY475_26535 [Planctomycetes bacterium]|nr:hypothetical protein [Planctomycetota bacterium]